jgi:hypothetical protein
MLLTGVKHLSDTLQGCQSPVENLPSTLRVLGAFFSRMLPLPATDLVLSFVHVESGLRPPFLFV